jgi:homoserine dehydrogenase
VTTYNLAFIGFGNVGRALAALLASPHSAVSERYGIDYQVTGVAARRLGWWADERGLDPAALGGVRCADLRDWLVFETTPLDPHAGQPALDYPRESLAAAALDYGARRSAGAVKGRNGSA